MEQTLRFEEAFRVCVTAEDVAAAAVDAVDDAEADMSW